MHLERQTFDSGGEGYSEAYRTSTRNRMVWMAQNRKVCEVMLSLVK